MDGGERLTCRPIGTHTPHPVKPHEIYSNIDPAITTGMLDWFRENNRNVYKSLLASIAKERKLRLVYIQKKPVTEQYEWICKNLKVKMFDSIGEHIMQAYLMSAQQSMLGMFCDGLGIPHDGKGSVVGDLPKDLDSERLDQTVDRLIDVFDPKMLTFYLRCFNLQSPGGWPVLTAKLESDERLGLA